MKRWEYVIAVEEDNRKWTLWLQSQKSLTTPLREFESDLEMLEFMSFEGWELGTSIELHDKLPRLIFKRKLS